MMAHLPMLVFPVVTLASISTLSNYDRNVSDAEWHWCMNLDLPESRKSL